MPFDKYGEFKEMAIKNNKTVEKGSAEYFVTTHSSDGFDSEIVSENAYNAIAEHLQSDCREFAEQLQTNCKLSAKQPTEPICRPKPLLEGDNFLQIEELLNNKKYIRSISAGIFKNINEILDNQKGLPSYIIEDFIKRGIKTSDAEVRRDILPLYRLKKKDKMISKLKIVNLILTVALIITISIYYFQSPISESEIMPTTVTDSILTYAELMQYVNVYQQEKHIMIYPYSVQIILNRINEKKITDITGIKNEIDARIRELKKR